MKRLLVSLMVLGMIGMVSVASAGSLDNAKVGVTLKSHATKAQCTTNAPSLFGCNYVPNGGPSNLVTSGSVGLSYDMYLVCLDVNPAAGLGGAALGIAYPGTLAIYSWTKCSDLEFPGQGWPASGGGNSITFDVGTFCPGQVADASDPQGEGAVLLGWFYTYAYGPSLFEVTKRNIAIPDFKVADCTAAESSPLFPDFAGKAGFGVEGFDPCLNLGTPVQTTTWGAIKKGLE